jgi:hypothetical protein
MPRQSGRSERRSSGFSSSRSPSYGRMSSQQTSSSVRPQAPQQPAYTSQPTTSTQSSGSGMMSGIGSTIVQGMAFEGGNEIGREFILSMMVESSGQDRVSAPVENRNQLPVKNQQQQVQKNQNPCQVFNIKFFECLKCNNNDISSCQSVFNDLKVCQNAMI